MPLEDSSISVELGRLLDEFSVERGLKVACLVLIGPYRTELIYPSGLDNKAIDLIEGALLDSLVAHRGAHMSEGGRCAELQTDTEAVDDNQVV